MALVQKLTPKNCKISKCLQTSNKCRKSKPLICLYPLEFSKFPNVLIPGTLKEENNYSSINMKLSTFFGNLFRKL